MDHPHVIQRLVLEIALPQQDNAFAIQNRMSVHCQAVITRVLDEVCEAVCKQAMRPDQFLQIEKLVIDLGATPLEHLEAAFTARLDEVFLEALTSRAHRSQGLQMGQRAPGAPSGAVGKEGATRQFSMAPPRPGEDRILSSEGFELALIRHFLHTGALPWWAEGSFAGRPEQVLAALLKETPDEAQLLIAGEIRDERVRHRMIYQFSDPLIMAIMALLAPGKKRSVRRWVADLTEIYQQGTLTGVASADFRLVVWDALMAEAPALRQEKFDEKELLWSIVEAISRRHALSEMTILQSLQRGLVRTRESRGRFESPFAPLIEKGFREGRERHPAREASRERGQWAETDEAGLSLEERSLKTARAEFRPDQGRPRQDEKTGDVHAPWEKKMSHDAPEVVEAVSPGSMKELVGTMRTDPALPPAHEASSAPDATVAAQEIGVENAGLVLLWPYLNNFLKVLSLLKGDRFVDETAGMRAVHLMQYLVTGKADTPEYRLPLNKLLCGRDMIEPVIMSIDMSGGEKSECETLLTAVIAHWNALKNTSIEGFRRSFLQRNGVLTDRDDTWLLRVERQAYDLLLERLPWGISMIKLSWMKRMLVVEW